MSTAPYARFYKCDLHMHTPFSPYWKDTATRGKCTDSETRKSELARLYLKACHREKLDVIGVTEHNFASAAEHSFVHYLQNENNSIAAEEGRMPLIIYPGFEVGANVGRGCHVICLFPPDVPLNVVEGKVTSLELPPEDRFDGDLAKHSRKNLQELLSTIQKEGKYKGIVICAHSTEDNGIFDDDRINRWLQASEFINDDLFCVEIPKPIERMSAGWQHLLRMDTRCLPEWRRDRAVACIMSSDCYALNGSEHVTSNYIGYRYTWIKMSQPSIESLRQAFLDHASRIRFGVTSPDSQYTYPKIKSLKVTGASFLRCTEELILSPNLNCLIGSRGTGKSTLVDYMRLALDHLRQVDLPETLAAEITGRAIGTLLPESSIDMDLETAGGIYKLKYRNNTDPKRQIIPPGADKPDLTLDIRTLFPCRMLSQREIDHSVSKKDQASLLRFLDDFIVSELSEVSRQENVAKGTITQTEASLSPKFVNQDRRRSLETTRRDLQLQFNNHEKLTALLPRWREVVQEREFFQALLTECEALITELTGQVESIKIQNAEIPAGLASCPELPVFQEAIEIVKKAATGLKSSMEAAIETFRSAVQRENSSLSRIRSEQWKPVFDQVETDFQAAQKEAPEQGPVAIDIMGIPQRLIELDKELALLDAELIEIQQLELARRRAVKELQQIWVTQTEARSKKAFELMSRLSPFPGAKPFVEIEVRHQANFEELIRTLESKLLDRRKLNEEDIRGLVFHLIKHSKEGALPRLQMFINEVRKGEDNALIRDGLENKESKREVFFKTFTETVIRQLEVMRISDSVTYNVYRADGTLAGPVEKVSAGQQGTAILNLLLAAGNEPLIIDTPEEGLDSEGVYAELVPLFRREKESRQVVVVTHNANIPVNADAEGIIAMEASGYIKGSDLGSIATKNGQSFSAVELTKLDDLIRWPDWEKRVREYLDTAKHLAITVVNSVISDIGGYRSAEGRVKRIASLGGEARPAVGALDSPMVNRAVQDIMEGSAEAFRKRREKYGF